MTIALVPRGEEVLRPVERLEALCDPGSLTPMRSDVRSRRIGERARRSRPMGERARAADGLTAGRGDGRAATHPEQ